MNNNIRLFIFFTFFIQSLCAMEPPFDKQLILLNEALVDLIERLEGQSVIIGQKEIHLMKKQFDDLKLEKSENFSKVIQSISEDTERGEPIFLPPLLDSEAFQYLVNWQTTKAKLDTLKSDDDLIIRMINTANFLGMDKIINILINIFVQHNNAALYANPFGWWKEIQEKVGKNLNLPEELQAKLSSQFFPNINLILFNQIKKQIPDIKANGLYFQPNSGFINLAVTTFESMRTPQPQTGMLYQADETFIFQEIPNCPRCSLQKKHILPHTEPAGWSPSGEWLLVTEFPSQNDICRLFYWNQSRHIWQQESQLKGSGLSWSPNSKYIATEAVLNVPGAELLFYKNSKNSWQEIVKIPFNTVIQSLSWSADSKYVAVTTDFNKTLKIVEYTGEDKFEITFTHLGQSVSTLIWQPENLTLGVGLKNGQIQLWSKKDKEWIVEQVLEPNPAFKQSKEVYSYFKWSLDGKYLITYTEISDREESSFNLWQKEQNQWIIKNTFELNKNMRIVDLYWDKNNKFLALIGNIYRTPNGFFGRGRTISQIQLWSQAENSWNPSIIPLNTPMRDWDILYNANKSFRSLATVEDNSYEILLWDLQLLNKKFYFTLEQLIPLIDWYNKIKRGEKIPFPEFKSLEQ